MDPRVEALLARLRTIRYAEEGRVAMLVGKPAWGMHVERDEVELVPGFGFAGDHPEKSHWRGRRVPGREVTAVNREVLDALDVEPLRVGDNLVVEGFDLALLEPGDLLCVGQAVLRRSERPHRPCDKFRARSSPEAFLAIREERYRGALFVVLRGGRIRRGDRVRRCRER